MWRQGTLLLTIFSTTSCGSPRENRAASITLASSAFSNGGAIPTQYTCDGADRSPPLAWPEPPQGTRSFVLVVDDPDASGGAFRHWAIYDIPANVRSLAAGAGNGTAVFPGTLNDFGKPGYGGPCPPKGGGAHRYSFKLHAVKVGRLAVSVNASAAQVDKEAEMQLVARAELIGTYERR